MKTISLLLAGIALGGVCRAQLPAPVPFPAFDPPTLDKLVAPIAMYPDALISLILPAATDQADLAAADQYLSSPGNYAQVDAQGWDPSVESLAHYPTLVAWLDQNPAYAQELGAAFQAQPQDLMGAVQRLRQKALAAGLLTNTAQQLVFSENGEIVIASAQADVVYIPAYDPTFLYTVGYPEPGSSWISWSDGYATGPWLDFGCDWIGGRVWIGNSFNHRAWASRRSAGPVARRAPVRSAPVPTPVNVIPHERPRPGWGDRGHQPPREVPHPANPIARQASPNEPAYRTGAPRQEPVPGRIVGEAHENRAPVARPTESRPEPARSAPAETRSSNDNKDKK